MVLYIFFNFFYNLSLLQRGRFSNQRHEDDLTTIIYLIWSHKERTIVEIQGKTKIWKVW